MRNTAYWGGTPALDGVNLTFYADTASQIQALQGGELDLIPQFGYQEGPGSSRASSSRSSRPSRRCIASCRCASTCRRSTTGASASRWPRRSTARRSSRRCSAVSACPATTRRSRRRRPCTRSRSPSASRTSRKAKKLASGKKVKHAAHHAERVRAARPRGARPERREGDRLLDLAEAPQRHRRTTPGRARRRSRASPASSCRAARRG